MRNILYSALFTAGYHRWLLRRAKANKDCLFILNLHRVSTEQNSFYPPLHPRVFEDLLIYVTSHFEVSRFGDLSETNSQRPRLILSFDDGTYDFVEYALPLLEKYAVRVNQNLIVDCVESGLPPWNFQLYDFLNAAPTSLISEMKVPGFEIQKSALRSKQDRALFGARLSRFLKFRSRDQRNELMHDINRLMATKAGYATTRMMGVEDFRSIDGTHEIGLHSASHESMANQSLDFFVKDLERGQNFFEKNLNRRPTIYAFPNGSYRQEHLTILESKGFEHILLVDEKISSVREQVHPRLSFHADNRASAILNASGLRSR